MEAGLFDKQQLRYPEGKVFAYALFALAIIERGSEGETKAKQLAQLVDTCILALRDESTLQNFHQGLALPYGAFYNGWANLVMKEYLSSPLFQYSLEQELCKSSHLELTALICTAKVKSVGLLETYAESYWPADNLVALCSLPISADSIKTTWMKEIQSYRDDSLGLIIHALDDRKVVRGSSQSMMQYFLSEFSKEEFENSYRLFSENFVDTRGVKFVREYKKGSQGEGDFDSGPMVLGYGSAATIMHIKTGSSTGDMRLTWGLMNLLGIPINLFGRKFYLFEQEPIFDLFMLWVGI